MANEENRQTPNSVFTNLMQTLFNVQPDEARQVVLMFLFSLTAVGAFILGRIVRDTLLLAPEGGVKRLPLLMAIAPVAVSIMAYLYSRIANRFRRDQLIILVNSLLVFVLILIYGGLLLSGASTQLWLYDINYVFVEVMGTLQVIQFWTLASDLFNSRQAKRIFAIIGGGAVLANLSAFAVRPLIRLLQSAEHLIPILVLMLGACIYLVVLLGRQNKAALEQVQAHKRAGQGQVIKVGADTGRIWSSRLLLIIAGVVAVTYFTTTAIDYQFKAVAGAIYKSKDGLAQYFSYFYGITGLISCVIQFLLARYILGRFGMLVALLLLPLGLLAGSLTLGTAPLLLAPIWATTLTKGTENVLRYTINDVSLNLLYVPITSHLRARAKAFIDGILKPGAIGLSAGLILLLSQFHASPVVLAQRLSWVALVFLLGWVALLFLTQREYVKTLLNSMNKKRLDLDESALNIQDESASKALLQVLEGNNIRQIYNALEIIPNIKNYNWNPHLVRLLELDDDEVRVSVLALLGRKGNLQFNQEIYSFLEHSSATVRAQAVESFCAVMTDKAVTLVVPYLSDESAQVRAAAIVGLIKYGGLDGILHAAEHLKKLLEHEDPEMRNYGARVLGRIEVRTFYQPLFRLFNDEDVSVQNSAIEAAGRMASPELVPSLIFMLKKKETAQAAIRALSRYGETVVPTVARVLSNTDEDINIRMNVTRVLSQIGTQQAVEVLESNLICPQENLRYRVIKALHRIHNRNLHLVSRDDQIRWLLQEEIKTCYQVSLELESLRGQLARLTILEQVLGDRRKRTLDRIFSLLALLYPPKEIGLIYAHLLEGSPTLRANAIELLDNLLQIESKRALLPLLEGGSLRERAAELFALYPPQADEILKQLLHDESPWLVSSILFTIGENQLTSFLDSVWQALSHEEAMIRETALLALGSLIPAGDYLSYLRHYTNDPSPLVARFAQDRLQVWTQQIA